MIQQEVIDRITQAEAGEIQEYVAAAFNRYRQLYPEWDITYMAIPKNDPEDRKRTIQYMIEMLCKEQMEELQFEKQNAFQAVEVIMMVRAYK